SLSTRSITITVEARRLARAVVLLLTNHGKLNERPSGIDQGLVAPQPRLPLAYFAGGRPTGTTLSSANPSAQLRPDRRMADISMLKIRDDENRNALRLACGPTATPNTKWRKTQ